MSTALTEWLHQERISPDHKATIRSAARANNMSEAEAVRWLIFQAGVATGHWPGSETVHWRVPPVDVLIDPRVAYITEGDADGNGGDA